MINVNQITSELAKMPDRALQQYAAMHKNDPYTVTLALSEANRRKQMRMGAQGAGAMPQPTVVDQDIAQMSAPQQQMAMAHGLPEEQGLGQLPAPNMQGMAGGGIVAFDDGGEVPGYAGGVFTGPGNPEDYRAYAMQKAAKMGLDPAFVDSIFSFESRTASAPGGYDPLAKSGSGSTGIGQLVKKTAQSYGLKTGKQDERLNPIMNIDASLAYMADLNKKYKGNPELMAVAYNQGEPVLDAHLRNTGGKLVPAQLQQEIATKLKAEGKLSDAQIAARAAEPVTYLAKTVNAQQPVSASLSKGESVEPPTQAVDNSIPTNYKQEQAAQQAPYDAEVNRMQNEGLLDKTKRIGKGIIGAGEAGLNFAGQVTGYPMGILHGLASNALTGRNEDIGKHMENYVRDVSYDPRTPEGQHLNELKNQVLSGLSPYVGHLVSGKPTKAAGKSPIVKPGIETLTESPAAKAAEPSVQTTKPATPADPHATWKQLELFPQDNMPVTAPKTNAVPNAPVEPFPKTPLQLAQEKQAAARTGLAALPGADNFVGPRQPITVMPENQAVKTQAAARLQSPAPTETVPTGTPFEVTPENAAVAEQARARLANQKETNIPEQTTGIKPAEPAMSADEMLNRALEAERTNQTGIAALNQQKAVNAVLPGASLAVPSAGVPTTPAAPNTTANAYPTGIMGGIATPAETPEEETPTATAEAPKKGGMDYNDMMIKLGLGLMAGKSPNALTNVGEAGIGALQMTAAEKKAQAEQALHEAQAEMYRQHGMLYGTMPELKAQQLSAKERMFADANVEKAVALAMKANPYAYQTIESQTMLRNKLRSDAYDLMLSNKPAGGAAPAGAAGAPKFLGFENS